ncbi:1,4-alpha-glucan branching protein [Corynebacterium doosanense CAU 212 = DSM 45436]|uniref:Malto-oligosyltrehalose trehalohydrolase n=2 Tax=Corynebacterium TaxID=1716 RepID=A0A097IH50_9CORY|nr:1,4-alpha-glucan branching protein [Corynebacterium doosanense CAU 212 = DSM 45436]
MHMNSFSVWAPLAKDVRLRIGEQIHDMHTVGGNWWEATVAPEPGMRYGYELCVDDEWSTTYPDPRTRSQPDGIHGLSEVVAEDFDWSDHNWSGRSLAGMVLYEMHVGTFTAGGTFDSAIEQLDYLADLGVNAVEVMPIQPFGGTRNWGYDSVDWYAVHEAYGGPEGFKRFVDAAHARGLAVVLDVVYNHFGPDGNYLGAFGPYTTGGATEWGDVVNFSGENSDEVRDYALGAVRQWLDEFHVDGLRLDAVHSFDDRRAFSIMEDFQTVADELTATDGRPRSLIAESDLNDPRLITEKAAGGYGLAGQWVDDIHHGLHTLVSGEDHAYYSDYASMEVFAETLRKGWWFTGTYSSFRGRTHGRALNLERTPAWRLVTYTTTHDQTGNRAAGDRPSMNLSPEQQVLKAAVVLFSPFTPMLFMGEEYGATTPFPFFVSHTNEEIMTGTREGRKREFSRAGWREEDIADPTTAETFDSAKLLWDFTDEQLRIHEAYRRMIALRTSLRLANPDLRQLRVEHGGEEHRWLAMGSGEHLLLANLSADPQTVPFGGEAVYSFSDVTAGTDETRLGPWEFVLVRR